MKSIRFRLWVGMMSLVIIVLILLWLFQIVFLESFYTKMRIENIKTKATDIINNISNENSNEFKDKLDSFAFNNNISIEMLNLNGDIIYETGENNSGPQMMGKKNSAIIQSYENVLSGNESDIVITHPKFGNKFMVIGFPIPKSEKITSVLILNMPLAPVEETVFILKYQLLYISFILLICALIISYVMSKSFTKPILEIKRASEKMASGDFLISIKSQRNDEIGKLAETINYLGNQLSKIDKLRKDFIANVSHELRTPLSLIRGYAETIRDVTGDNIDKRERQIGIIIGETERLSKLVDDILNLSQIQSGHININKTKFNIKNLIDNIVSSYEDLSGKTGVKIKTITNDAHVEGDKSKIEQVFYNLINNAFNHTPSGGTIKVNMVDCNEKIIIEISDTGSGIDEEDIPNIWDRYYKGDKTSGKKIIGTGLGLAIVKGILQAHNYNFGVESKKGIGTTFWFELKNILK